MDTNEFSISPQEHFELAELAKKQKATAFIAAENPIGNDLSLFLEKNNIILLEYPIDRAGSNSFSALFLQTKSNGQMFSFIGVNTADYYDKQIFAIAHELYHFAAHDKPHISRDGDQTNPEERKAEYYAAEFLLPLAVLKVMIWSEFSQNDISGVSQTAILRFIARVHCTWWLPYKAIVKRLYEANAITDKVFDSLYAIDERDKAGLYYRIGCSTNEPDFNRLNTVTKRIGTSAHNLEHVIRNFEDDIISEDELIQGLRLFNTSPDAFGIDFGVDESSEDWDAFFAGGSSNDG
jgi:Zn-dependent peptidase ImmA (M78 family)